MAQTHKPGQGILVRRLAFWSLFVMIVWGGQELYGNLIGTSWGKSLLFESGDARDAYIIPVLDQSLNVAFLVCWGIVAVGGFLLFRMLNKPRTAEFLIATDEELGKVTWPSRKDAWNSSVIVMVFVVFMAGFLLSADFLLGQLFDLVIGGGGDGGATS